MQCICLHKEMKLHYKMHSDATLLSPARFAESKGENAQIADAFSRKIFRQKENFLGGGQNLRRAP